MGSVIVCLISMLGKLAYLFGVDHIHNDTSLQHAGEARLDSEGGLGIAIYGTIERELSCHSAVPLVERLLFSVICMQQRR
jgi:hypothetical protein